MSKVTPTLLIVDDTESNIFSLEEVLSSINIKIDKALSGKQAIEMIQKKDYSVVLMDVQMPEMDGFETCNAIGRLKLKRYPPIIFMTAINRDQKYITKGYELGCIDYLIKPLDAELVRNKVCFCMSLHSEVLENEILIKKLEEQREKLKRSNDELEQFAYVASHDLQEPLRMVSSYVQLLAEKYKGKLDAQADKYIAYAVDGAHRMHILIKDLLTLSRLERKEIFFDEISINDILKEVTKDLAKLIETTNTKLVTEKYPSILGDKTQIRQLFQNIINNAIKFNKQSIPKVEIKFDEKGDECEFAISDNGIGIEAKYFEQVFLIFRRINGRKDYEGSGIGLSICKKIIERHGGKIWVTSQLGEGSTFHFTLKKFRGDVKNGANN